MEICINNYDRICEMVKSFIANKPYVLNEIIDDDEINVLLNNIFGDTLKKDVYYKEFKVYIIDSLLILDYKSVDAVSKKEVNNLVIVKENNPVFKIEYYNCVKHRTRYIEESYCTYLDNSNKISNRLNSVTLRDDQFIKNDISLLNKHFDDNSYSKHKYELYFNGYTCIALKNRNNMYINSEEKFKQLMDNVNANIEKIHKKIASKLNYILEIDDTKIYNIKRKKDNG